MLVSRGGTSDSGDMTKHTMTREQVMSMYRALGQERDRLISQGWGRESGPVKALLKAMLALPLVDA